MCEAEEQEIAEDYRRAYGAAPQEEWIGEVGVALVEAEVRRLNRGDVDGR